MFMLAFSLSKIEVLFLAIAHYIGNMFRWLFAKKGFDLLQPYVAVPGLLHVLYLSLKSETIEEWSAGLKLMLTILSNGQH